MQTEEAVVLLVDGDATDIEAARAAFGSDDDGFRLEVAERLDVGLARIAAGGIDIILAHLHLPDAVGFEVVEKILLQAQGTPVIVLGWHDDAEMALQAVRAGAQDYLVKGRMGGPSLARCVRHALERHRHFQRLLSRGRRTGEGRSVAILGIKGGVGTSTTVLNLATALGLQGKDTLVIELGAVSSLAIHLKRPRGPDASEFFGPDVLEIDSNTLGAKLVSLPFGFRALMAPPRTAEVREIQPNQAHSLVQSAGELAEFVLVELPAQISAVHRSVIPAVDFVALVLEPDVLSMEFARSTIALLEDWGVDSGACGLVLVNRAALANSLRPHDLKLGVGREVLGIIPPSGEACMIAFQAGKPLLLFQPDSKFSLAVTELAERLVQSPIGVLAL